MGLVGLAALAAPALAQDDGYGDSGMSNFAGLRGSFAFGGTINSTLPSTPPAKLHAGFDEGGGASVYVGTRLPAGFRVELEGLYRTMDVERVTINHNDLANSRGYTSAAAPMVNLYWDVPLGLPVQPFIGAGVGAAYTKTSLHDAGGLNGYLNNSNWNLAYEAMAGVAVPMSSSSRFTAMYRWMRVDDVKFNCGISGGTPASSCKGSPTNQSVDLGLEMDM